MGVAVVWWVWQWCGGCGSSVVGVAVAWWVWQWRGGCGSGVVGVAVQQLLSTVVDTHAGHSGKVEGLQCHLCPGFTNALGPHCPYCSS